jgi:hypothetical protein
MCSKRFKILKVAVGAVNTWSVVMDLWIFVSVDSLKMALRCRNMNCVLWFVFCCISLRAFM